MMGYRVSMGGFVEFDGFFEDICIYVFMYYLCIEERYK